MLYYTLRYNVIVFIMKDNEEAVKDASTKSPFPENNSIRSHSDTAYVGDID